LRRNVVPIGYAEAPSDQATSNTNTPSRPSSFVIPLRFGVSHLQIRAPEELSRSKQSGRRLRRHGHCGGNRQTCAALIMRSATYGSSSAEARHDALSAIEPMAKSARFCKLPVTAHGIDRLFRSTCFGLKKIALTLTDLGLGVDIYVARLVAREFEEANGFTAGPARAAHSKRR
jgi:hypothetical protein